MIAVAHWHTFLVLTKRSRRMHEYYGNPETPRRIAEEIDRLSSEILPSGGSGTSAAARTVAPAIPTSTRRSGRGRTVGTPRHWIDGFSRVKYGTPSTIPAAIRPVGLEPWPLPNLWPGVSVEDQSRIERIGDLLKTSAAARWVCFEPLLDRVMPEALPAGDGYFDTLAGGHYAIDGRGRTVATEGPAWQPLDWVVAGGEIGVGARPTHPDCLRALRDAIFVTTIVPNPPRRHLLDAREGSYTPKDRRPGRRWCPGAELNHRHTDFQSVALPTELPGRLARGAYRGDSACLSSRALPWLAFFNWNRLSVRHDRFFC